MSRGEGRGHSKAGDGRRSGSLRIGKMGDRCAKPAPRLPVILPRGLKNSPEEAQVREGKERTEQEDMEENPHELMSGIYFSQGIFQGQSHLSHCLDSGEQTCMNSPFSS